MATVTMPQLGESVTEGTILQWLKKPGDSVELDDPLCEIETEKVTAELPSPFAGIMGEVLVAEGETVEVGVPLCEVVESGEPAVPPAPGHTAAAPAGVEADDALAPAGDGGWNGGPMAIPKEEATWTTPEPLTENGAEPRTRVIEVPAAAPVTVGAQLADSEDRSGFYSPAVMRLAREHAVDLAGVRGTGLGGRITRRDVEAAVADGSAAPQTRPAPANEPSPPPAPQPAATASHAEVRGRAVVPLTATRKTIAAHLTKSNLEAPQAWTMVEADVTGLVRRREAARAAYETAGVKLTLFHYFVEATCRALREVPALNARWEGGELVRYSALNVGVAVAAESGLVVPVLKDAGSLSLEGIARGVSGLADRARDRRLRVEDIEGGTFTVNNTGAFGSIASKPIVNHPEVAIVTFERAVQRPVVRDDAIAIRWMANVCLAFDHRALDGLEAGQFLAALKAGLEAEPAA